MVKEKKTFEYTDDNYISEMKLSDSTTKKDNLKIYKILEKYLNGVYSFLNRDDEMVGKTIDIVYLMEDNEFCFYGFTDGTFVIREVSEFGSYSSSGHNVVERLWGNAIILPWYILVNDFNNGYRVYRNPDVKITPIGKWIEEHTDIDVIGFYQEFLEYQNNAYQEYLKDEKKRKLKAFYDLKKELGL